MSASRDEKHDVELARLDHDRSAAARGHTLRWTFGENANRRGCVYFLLGSCTACEATVTVGAGWSSSQGPVDARKGRCRKAAPPTCARRDGAFTVVIAEPAPHVSLKR